MPAAPKISDADWIAIEREYCGRRLSNFVREAWRVLEPSTVYVHSWHIDALCLHLEAITHGTFLKLGLRNRLLINVPPGTMKSLIVSVFWPAWEWGPAGYPSLRYLTSSYSEAYAKRDSRRMRDLVTSEWYQSLWGDSVRLTRTGEMSFENDAFGKRDGVAFKSMTGGRGDRVIIDDPHSTEGAESDADRATAVRIFRESVPTRVNDARNSAIVVIMQRLHSQDVSAAAKEFGYVHLMLPMEFEPDRKCVTPIFEDPRTEEGELLCPARFPRETIEADKSVMGAYAVSGQYQQRPAPRSGGMFQRSDFEIVDAIPASRSSRRVRAWDFAATKETPGRKPDWTVGLRVIEIGGVFYVDDMQRDRWGPGEVERRTVNIASTDGTGVIVRIPQDPGAAGKNWAAVMVRLLAGYPVKVENVTGDKTVRARTAAAQAEAGNIKLLRGEWNEAFLSEVSAFPNAAHDDIVDALSDAINELALGSTYDDSLSWV